MTETAPAGRTRAEERPVGRVQYGLLVATVVIVVFVGVW